MKSLIVFIPSIENAGVEKNLFIICNFLIKKIDKIYLITANNNFNKKLDKNIHVVCPKNKFWNNKSRLLKTMYCFFLIINKFEKKNYLLFSFQANFVATIIAKIYEYKLVLRLNTSPNKYIHNSFQRIFFKIIYKSADQIIVNSKKFKNLLKKKLNIDSIFIYNPLISKYKIKTPIKKIKKNLNILNIGRLTDQKDQLTLLKALDLLKKNKIKFTAKIIGSGNKYKNLKEYIDKNNLKMEVQLLGYKPNGYKFMTKADVFILSSKYEGLPNVLIEAQQSNTPIISSNCPTGPSEILMEGKLGSLYPVGDYKKLYTEIKSFNFNKKKLIKKANLAIKYLKRFDKKFNCNEYYKIIKKYA
jgi:glycosyltransferase involved in cell wall biosynthesis